MSANHWLRLGGVGSTDKVLEITSDCNAVAADHVTVMWGSADRVEGSRFQCLSNYVGLAQDPVAVLADHSLFDIKEYRAGVSRC